MTEAFDCEPPVSRLSPRDRITDSWNPEGVDVYSRNIFSAEISGLIMIRQKYMQPPAALQDIRLQSTVALGVRPQNDKSGDIYGQPN